MAPSVFYPEAQKLAERLTDKYVSPPGYVEWNKMLRGMTSVCNSLLNEAENRLKTGLSNEATPRGEAALVMAFLSHASTDPPAFYLTKELIDAFCMTKVPAMGGAPNRVLDSFVLMVPHNTFEVENGYISHIHVVDECLLLPDDGLSAGIEYFVGAVTNRAYGISKVLRWDDVPQDTGNDRLTALVKNVILAYNYQPEMFSETPAQTVGGRGSGFGKKPALTRSPLATRWLGADYVIKKERLDPSYAGSSGRVGNPKRPHWRQGHWHTVCFGPGHRQRKQQWFQPVYINAA